MSTSLTEMFLAAALLLAGVIHLLPVTGAISAGRLAALYGVAVDDSSLILLLRHRALLFGVLGAAFVAAAFVPAWRTVAAVVALFSMLSFVALATAPDLGGAIRRVVRVDLVLSAVVGVALALRLLLAER